MCASMRLSKIYNRYVNYVDENYGVRVSNGLNLNKNTRSKRIKHNI